ADLRGLERCDPPVDRLLLAMGAARGATLVQLVLRPAPRWVERRARQLCRGTEMRMRNGGHDHPTHVDEQDLRAGLDVAYGSLFFCDIRVAAETRADADQVASGLRASTAENRLTARGTAL